MSRYVADSILLGKPVPTDPCAMDRLDQILWKYGRPEVGKVRIVLPTDGRQIRTQITGKKSIPTKSYMSKRYACQRYLEGATEIAKPEFEEVETHYVNAIAQSCRIEATISGKLHSHIPDFANLYADGRRTLSDAKREWYAFRTPQGMKQTLLGEIGAAILGYDYERFTLASLGSEVRRKNINLVQAHRFTKVPEPLKIRTVIALSQGSMSLGHLSEVLHPTNGRAMVFALMVQRIVEIDLETRISDRSECRSVPPLTENMPGLFQ